MLDGNMQCVLIRALVTVKNISTSLRERTHRLTTAKVSSKPEGVCTSILLNSVYVGLRISQQNLEALDVAHGGRERDRRDPSGYL